MKIFPARVKQVEEVLTYYPDYYPKPLHAFLQEYFRQRKQMGSRDRKEVRALCYALYRLWPFIEGKELQEELPKVVEFITSPTASRIDFGTGSLLKTGEGSETPHPNPLPEGEGINTPPPASPPLSRGGDAEPESNSELHDVDVSAKNFLENILSSEDSNTTTNLASSATPPLERGGAEGGGVDNLQQIQQLVQQQQLHAKKQVEKLWDVSYIEELFPLKDKVSEAFRNNENFLLSHLLQPFVWAHVAEVQAELFAAQLELSGISYIQVTETSFALPPEADIGPVFSGSPLAYRIQDFSTNATANYFQPKAEETWWDCCAGSGGKSLALLDIENSVKLWATDVRESILENLKWRFRQEKKWAEQLLVIDASEKISADLPLFDGIIADVPCTGSGTWARNPENLVLFEEETIAAYSQKQLQILKNVWPFLKPGKPLVYITCSIFADENENVISAFLQNHDARVEQQVYLKGYEIGAENIFVCRLIKV